MRAQQVWIRPLGRAHREAAALFAAAHPERANELQSWAEPASIWPRRRVAVAGTPPRVVAYLALWPVLDDRFRFDLVVAPDLRRRGIGSRLLDRLIGQARVAGAATVQARADTDRVESLAFLHRRRFHETMRMHRLVLDVAAATIAPFAGVERRLAAEEITITTLADEQHRIGDACWIHLCDLYNAAREGWPDPDPDPGPGPPRPSRVEEVRELYEQSNRRWPEPCFLAVHGTRYAGFAGPLGTGVRPDLRGRGIATALKVRVIADARARGVPTLRSASGNPAMLKVNERLGYRRTTTEVRLVRPLN